tara:strand:- start:27 stop:977 length:951 start_codon:yes stop_codon:yes gene_type:complete
MASPTGTYTSYDAVGNREDLQDHIYNISPTDCPFISSIGTDTAKSTKHEWQTDVLADATTANAQIEGDDVTGSTSSPTTREHNYCQISRKDVVVSNTQNTVLKAGRGEELQYQLLKRGRELKRDMEAILTGNQGYTTGGTTTARKLRSLESWLSSNTSRASNGGNAASATVGATDGTQRAFTEAMLKSVIQSCYGNGAEPQILMVGPANKQNVSNFTGRASARQNISDDRIQAAAHLYASDFGEIRVVPNRFQRERSAFVLDPEYASVAYLRRMQRKDLATTGDAMKKFIVAEYTLCMRNEGAHGVVADLTTTVST